MIVLSSFNTQPPEGGWQLIKRGGKPKQEFQHTAARRRLGCSYRSSLILVMFQHTAARRRLVPAAVSPPKMPLVSTHSRPKAAGGTAPVGLTGDIGFNTQPPEGGWISSMRRMAGFAIVSTHSRPKAAGAGRTPAAPVKPVSTHSRPKAAGA